MCGRLPSINVSFWCLSLFCEMILGQFILVVVFGEKYGANGIAIFRLRGLVWVRFNSTFCLPVLKLDARGPSISVTSGVLSMTAINLRTFWNFLIFWIKFCSVHFGKKFLADCHLLLIELSSVWRRMKSHQMESLWLNCSLYCAMWGRVEAAGSSGFQILSGRAVRFFWWGQARKPSPLLLYSLVQGLHDWRTTFRLLKSQHRRTSRTSVSTSHINILQI